MKYQLCIVVPTLNSFKHLSKLIKVLKEQTKQKDWRVVFVDGKSCKEHKDYLKQITFEDCRFEVIEQTQSTKGIFGAMNDGWEKVEENEWAVFWGSDDWPTDNKCIEDILSTINSRDAQNTLLAVFSGKYVDKEGRQIRTAKFLEKAESSFIRASEFKAYMKMGLTPPHQATIFSPKLRKVRYDDNLQICADLDIFLKLSSREDANAITIDRDIITMQNGGVSNQLTLKRLAEVAKTYKRELGRRWLKAIITRYINKVKNRIKVIEFVSIAHK